MVFLVKDLGSFSANQQTNRQRSACRGRRAVGACRFLLLLCDQSGPGRHRQIRDFRAASQQDAGCLGPGRTGLLPGQRFPLLLL